MLENPRYLDGNLPREIRRHRITYLDVLLRASAAEEIVVREGLKPRGLSYRETPTLTRVRMYEVVTVLRDVAGDRGRRAIRKLYAKPICELAGVPVCVLRR